MTASVLPSNIGLGAPDHRFPEKLPVGARPEQRKAYERYVRDYTRAAHETARAMRAEFYARHPELR
jgi:hypothetical protein